jgi:hypothetical protein
MVKLLETGLTGLIRNSSSPHSPALESPDVGLALNLSDFEVKDGRAFFTLHLTGRFPAAFLADYHRVHLAPVIFLQDTAGRSAAMRPIDTHKRYIPHPGPNWTDTQAVLTGRSTTFWIQIPMFVETGEIGLVPAQPSLYLTATLQAYESNSLALDTKRAVFTSIKEGAPHVIRLEAAAEDA